MTKKNLYSVEKLISVYYWKYNKKLLSIKIGTKNYKFIFGQFSKIGLKKMNSIIFRAYSIVSFFDIKRYIEFYISIKLNGKFSIKIVKIYYLNNIYLYSISLGIFFIKFFINGSDIFLISTGTGISAFLSILNDKIYKNFYKNIFLLNSVKNKKEISYIRKIKKLIFFLNYLRFTANIKLLVLLTRNKQIKNKKRRITNIIIKRKIEKIMNKNLSNNYSRIMICGNPKMILNSKEIFKRFYFFNKKNNFFKNIVSENYW